MASFFLGFGWTGRKRGEGGVEADGRGRHIGGRAVYYFEPLIGLMFGQIIEA